MLGDSNACDGHQGHIYICLFSDLCPSSYAAFHVLKKATNGQTDPTIDTFLK